MRLFKINSMTALSLCAFAAAALVVMSGCATVRGPALGVIYTDTLAGASVSSNQAGNRIGEACATSILGLVATGDASIEAARRNGGVTFITSVDEHSTSYVGIYGKYCTIVRGR